MGFQRQGKGLLLFLVIKERLHRDCAVCFGQGMNRPGICKVAEESVRGGSIRNIGMDIRKTLVLGWEKGSRYFLLVFVCGLEYLKESSDKQG